MKVADIEVGQTVLLAGSTKAVKARKPWRGYPSTHSFPAVKYLQKVKVLEVLPKGRAIVQESWVTWDRWMEDPHKKPITKTKEYEVGTRSLIPYGK